MTARVAHMSSDRWDDSKYLTFED